MYIKSKYISLREVFFIHIFDVYNLDNSPAGLPTLTHTVIHKGWYFINDLRNLILQLYNHGSS